MKQGKKLTYEQKKKVSNKGLDPNEWMMVKTSLTEYVLINKKTGEQTVVEVA